jgi:peptidoglycan/LPS O-acetylase OafA/YrhL
VFTVARRRSTGAVAAAALRKVSLEPLTYDEYRSLRYFPALDALRCYGMVMVVSAHMHDGIWGWVPAPKGLTFFFVMSGFLITTLLLREEEVRGKVSLAAFYIRRACRIFPLYYLVLGTYVFLILVVGLEKAKVPGLKFALPYYLTYTNEFTLNRHFKGEIFFQQSWSLGVEEKYYLLWPIVAFVLLRAKGRTRIAFTGGLSAVLLAIALPASWPNWYGPIFVGCLLAFLLHSKPIYDKLSVLATRRWNIPIALGLLAATVVSPWHDGVVVHFYSPLLALFLIGATVGRLPYLNFLRIRPALYVGKRTYGMYLVHLLCINAAEVVFRTGTGLIPVSVGALIAAFFISLGVAAVLHRLVEQPMIDVGRRWTARRAGGLARVERMGAQAAP